MATKMVPQTEAISQQARGFPMLPCPKCGEVNGVHLNVSAFADNYGFTCNHCDNGFGLDSIRLFLDRWGAALAWLETAPKI